MANQRGKEHWQRQGQAQNRGRKSKIMGNRVLQKVSDVNGWELGRATTGKRCRKLRHKLGCCWGSSSELSGEDYGWSHTKERLTLSVHGVTEKVHCANVDMDRDWSQEGCS